MIERVFDLSRTARVDAKSTTRNNGLSPLALEGNITAGQTGRCIIVKRTVARVQSARGRFGTARPRQGETGAVRTAHNAPRRSPESSLAGVGIVEPFVTHWSSNLKCTVDRKTSLYMTPGVPAEEVFSPAKSVNPGRASARITVLTVL